MRGAPTSWGGCGICCPELRKRPDFPAGEYEYEDILRLSDPPWYTACPNPFLADFVAHYGPPAPWPAPSPAPAVLCYRRLDERAG